MSGPSRPDRKSSRGLVEPNLFRMLEATLVMRVPVEKYYARSVVLRFSDEPDEDLTQTRGISFGFESGTSLDVKSSFAEGVLATTTAALSVVWATVGRGM